MVSFQQNILSLQAQFNSFFLQLESKKSQPDEKAVLSQDNIAIFERIQNKSQEIVKLAADEKNPGLAKIEEVFSLIQTMGSDVTRAGTRAGKETLTSLYSQGTAIKTSIQEIYLAHFNVANADNQNARVNAQNDETMAGNDFIVQRACIVAQSQFPKTCAFFTDCARDVNKGICGKELQEVLEMCLPTIWSIEALLKLSLVRLFQKELPLNTLDCFVLDEANQATFCRLASAFKSTQPSIIEQFLLHDESVTEPVLSAIRELNRFVEASVIERSKALGIMNLLQKRLNQPAYIVEIEELINQNNFSQACTIANNLRQEAQKLDAICLLIHHTPIFESLELLDDAIIELKNDTYRDDVLECYVRKILDSFPTYLVEARNLTLKIIEPEIRAPLLQRLANMALRSAPGLCFTILKEDPLINTERNPLLKDFILHHSKSEFFLCSQAFQLLSNLSIKKEVLDSIKNNFGWVSSLAAPAVAKQIIECCSAKSHTCIIGKLITAISANNPLLAVLIAIDAPDTSLNANTQKKMQALIETIVENEPQTAYEAAKRFKQYVDYPKLVAKVIETCSRLFPLMAIAAYSESCEYHATFSQETHAAIKQVIKAVDFSSFLKLVQDMPKEQSSRDSLLVALFENAKDSHPHIAFEAVQSITGPLRKLRFLKLFYAHCKWDDQQYIFHVLHSIQNSQYKSLFLHVAIQQILPKNPLQAIALCPYMPPGPELESLLVTLAAAAEERDQNEKELILQTILKIKDPEALKVEMAKSAADRYKIDKEQVLGTLPLITAQEIRDKAYAQLVEEEVEYEPQTNLGFVLAISDPTIRNKTLASLARRLAKTDWKKAVDFAESIEDPLLSWQFALDVQKTPEA